ncbi:hypothetical protein NQ318_002892 [Aromia moschata]|uniref:Uncharacterized protein n=1 Tax=Aromia moschata TaxID=1265417 RepID=A0AAV8Y992_9CUCU|nr:hypothetical protein NQ318_002892 [Aromia moschata]
MENVLREFENRIHLCHEMNGGQFNLWMMLHLLKKKVQYRSFKLYNAYKEIDVARHFKAARLRWTGHVCKKDQIAGTRQIFETKDQEEKDLSHDGDQKRDFSTSWK